MDKLKQKWKKDKQIKENKDKYPQILTDVKSIKENLKIKEILRTVKMNNNMRLLSPPCSNVLNNQDYFENDCLDSSKNNDSSEFLSATNSDVQIDRTMQTDNKINFDEFYDKDLYDECENKNECNTILEEAVNCLDSREKYNKQNYNDISACNINGKHSENIRDRKLSLDHTILSRQEGFSQSELDLHSIGKSPLERKSSFFKKKMDSFVRNTTEMFRRQNRSLQRQMSMSVSLQSLNEKRPGSSCDINTRDLQESYGSRTNLHAPTPIVRSTSSLSLRQPTHVRTSSPQNSFAGSQPTLHNLSSSTLEELHSSSDLSLNDSHLREAMLKSRAISMNSGLDSPYGQQRSKTSRSKRVTWIASEGMANYLRRKNDDEKLKDMQTCHSYQDFSCIPEHEIHYQRPDTKGRRLSYQRAVSGEDPVLPLRYQESTLRRRNQIQEYNEAHSELASYLAEFSRQGVPTLRGFEVAHIPDEAVAYLLWATKQKNIEDFFDWKSLEPEEISRQAVIRELIHTEAEYIRHLMAIVEVFIAAAHAIQDRGRMLGIQTSALFSNLPDLLNASLHFWNLAFMPMIRDAVQRTRPFDTDLMSYGFECFKDILMPYEKFVVDQSKLLEYYRKSQNDVEFSMYLAWCHSQKECNRLQLNDFLIKPMQRLTKYSLILQRIINHTRVETETSCLEEMEIFAKKYIVELNRSVRQHEEIERITNLEKVIDAYEIDLKDDEAEKVFKAYAQLNLRAPMLYCLPTHSRTLIHQADLRFRDGAKEIEVRVFLLTDMLLVCRKLTKGNQFKLIRPKYMIDKMIQTTKFDKHNRDLTGLAYVMVDDVGSSYASFILSESAKDPNPSHTLKIWENKVKEAKLTYELTVWVARNPNRDISQQDVDVTAEYTNTKARVATEEGLIEQEARERVATMVHRSMGASTDRDLSLLSLTTDSLEGTCSLYNQIVVGVSARPSIPGKRYNIVHRTSTVFSSGSTPRNSRLSSFQHSTSAQSHDDSQAGPSRLLHRASTSVERHLPPVPDANEGSPSITVSDSETGSTQAPTIKATPSKSSEQTERSSSAQSTLRIQPQNNVATLIYSLPDLTVEPSTPRTIPSPTQPTASERMYQSHQEILQRNRLTACHNQQYLSPDHRGSSYPPPSPTRASLKRGFAFSYTAKNPPLSKMGHVSSQSQMQDTTPTASGKDEKGNSPKSGRSPDKKEKKSKLTSSRSDRKDEKGKSNASSSCKEEADTKRQKDEISSSNNKDGSPGTSFRDESPGANLRNESPSASFRDESPGLSCRDESTSSSHRDESPGTSYREEGSALNISEISCLLHKEDDQHKTIINSEIDKPPLDRYNSSPQDKSDTLDSNIKDDDLDTSGRRESKSSDSTRKDKSFSFKDESYDSSHREESDSSNLKDRTLSEHNEDTQSTSTKSERNDTKPREGQLSQLGDEHDLQDDSNNKDDSPDFSHKTEVASIICKEDKVCESSQNRHKYTCLECEQQCNEYCELDEETIWNVWLYTEHAKPAIKYHNPHHRCRFSSSSTSSIHLPEDVSTSTSKATDPDTSLKYEIFSSSSSSIHMQDDAGPSEIFEKEKDKEKIDSETPYEQEIYVKKAEEENARKEKVEEDGDNANKPRETNEIRAEEEIAHLEKTCEEETRQIQEENEEPNLVHNESNITSTEIDEETVQNQEEIDDILSSSSKDEKVP